MYYVDIKGEIQMFINEQTPRTVLEQIACQDCGLGLDMIEPMTNQELLDWVRDWIEAGDECSGAA